MEVTGNEIRRKEATGELSELPDLLQSSGIRYKGYNLLSLSQVFFDDYCNGIYRKIHSVNFIKLSGTENLVKMLAFKAAHPFRRRRKINSFDYAFINEVKNKSMIEALELVRDEFGDENIVTFFSDKRLGVPGERSFNVFEFCNALTLLKSLAGVVVVTGILFRGRKELSETARLYKVSRLSLVLNILDSVLLIHVIRNMMKQVAFKKMVLISDVHKLSRILVLTAKNMGIKTTVIQHGAMVSESGYLPVLSDQILVWGQSSKDWLIKRGQDPGKIVITGAPRMTRTYPGTRNSATLVDRDALQVLIVMSEMTREEKFLITVRDGFVNTMPNAELTIKMHPAFGAANYTMIPQRVFENSGLKFSIKYREDINPMLESADVVIVTSSSVGMEAILYSKPLLQYKSPDFVDYYMSFEDFNCSLQFSDPAGLATILTEKEKLSSRLVNYSEFINYYFYRLDGLSARRCYQWITEDQAEQNFMQPA